MNENATHPGVVAKPSRWAGLMLWLASCPKGRWVTARGRLCRAVLTAGLIVAGVSAWALALVQPWTGRSGNFGIVTIAEGMDTGKIRAASVNVERLFPAQAPAARPLARNPFAPAAAQDATGQEGGPPDKAPSAALATPARNILETIKGLRLEVTLTAPTGERWAVINGENLREGDTIAGLEIIEIQEGKVKLRHGGTTCVLRMD
jgi:hypothetical protein